MSTPDQRRRLKAWHRAYLRQAAAWRVRWGDSVPPPIMPIVPVDLVRLTCGARTRAGTPCKLPACIAFAGTLKAFDGTRLAAGVPRNGRCRLHGGSSTGPRSAAGKAWAAANGFRPQGRSGL
jgi:hypothetical protein